MCSQESVSHFLKNRRLQYTGTHEGSVGQTPRPAPRAYVAVQEIKLLWDAPENRRGLGSKQFIMEELPHQSHGKKKPEHLPQLTSSVSEGHSPDSKSCLNIVSIRVLRGDSAGGQGHRRTFVGHMGLPKNSPEAVTAWEAQVKRRTMALLGKARKQTEKTPNPEDARQFLEREVVMNNKNPSKTCQQLKNLEDLRRDHLEGGGDIEELKQPRGLDRCGKQVAPLEENVFLQGKKIKPLSRRPMQAVCPPSVREEWPGEKLKPVSSGQDKLEDTKASREREAQPQFPQENTFLEGPSRVLDKNLRAEAKPQLLNRRKMQALEMAKSHEEFWVVNTRRKIQLSFQGIKQGASGRNIVRRKCQPREEVWDPTIQGTPVALASRAHTSSYQGPKDGCASKTMLTLRRGRANITYS